MGQLQDITSLEELHTYDEAIKLGNEAVFNETTTGIIGLSQSNKGNFWVTTPNHPKGGWANNSNNAIAYAMVVAASAAGKQVKFGYDNYTAASGGRQYFRGTTFYGFS